MQCYTRRTECIVQTMRKRKEYRYEVGLSAGINHGICSHVFSAPFYEREFIMGALQ